MNDMSKEKLLECDPRLIDIITEADKVMPIIVICGHRRQKEQDEAYAKGNSKVKWPMSKHNSQPSMAVDVAPYPLRWTLTKKFIELSGIIKGIAHQKGIELTWGGDFKHFPDMPHYEVKDA